MGVKRLQWYLEHCCQSASPHVNIRDLVARHREQFHNEVVIVVDGSSCIRTLYGDLEWIGGGQLKQFGNIAQDFVQAFADLGVRLVFFFDGPTVARKRNTWVQRRMDTLKKVYKVLDSIGRGKPSHTIPKELFNLPPGMGQLARLIFELICECEVYQSVTECDEEIAEYARNHQAFAILGQDTDFVILDAGEAFYLSMHHLNLQNMTTRIYDRWELAQSLKLHPNQLPLLATLMGNDVITSDELQNFHHHLLGRRNIDIKFLVPNIALYIRRLPCGWETMDEELSKISRHSLGNPSRVEDILESLHSYDAQDRNNRRAERDSRDPWLQLVAEAKHRHKSNKFPGMIYAIMIGLPFESSTSIEDFRENDLPSFARATQPIRQRLYGILLQEKPLPASGNHLVQEWCMAGPGSLDRANYIPAIPPQAKHPGLMKLWKSNQQHLWAIRWRLFVNSVSSNIHFQKLRSLRPYLVIPTLILFYFNELGCLSEWEIDAMLATATCLKHYNAARLAQVPPDPMTPKGIRVSNLIMRSTFILYILLASCGYPLSVADTAPWLFFDGKLFQLKYREAESGRSHAQLCEHRVDVLEEFNYARELIFSRH